MKTALALRHVHFEDLGTLEPLLQARGYRVRYLDPAVDALGADAVADAAAADLLVVLGGPLGACDEALYPFLAAEQRLIAQRLAQGRPLLGICLGAQLLASTGQCAQQAFARGPAVLGLQFHLELDGRSFERWLVGHCCELTQAGMDPRRLRADGERCAPALAQAAQQVMGRWLDGLEACAAGTVR